MYRIYIFFLDLDVQIYLDVIAINTIFVNNLSKILLIIKLLRYEHTLITLGWMNSASEKSLLPLLLSVSRIFILVRFLRFFTHFLTKNLKTPSSHIDNSLKLKEKIDSLQIPPEF